MIDTLMMVMNMILLWILQCLNRLTTILFLLLHDERQCLKNRTSRLRHAASQFQRKRRYRPTAVIYGKRAESLLHSRTLTETIRLQ